MSQKFGTAWENLGPTWHTRALPELGPLETNFLREPRPQGELKNNELFFLHFTLKSGSNFTLS